MKGLVGLPVCAALFVMLMAGHAVCGPLQVFTDRAHPVQRPATDDVQIIYLDEVLRIETALSQGLSAHPEKAQQQALSLLHSPQGQQLQRELMDAYAGLAQAWHWGITHIPAVVQDGYVVYGEAHIGRALQKMEAFKRGKKP